MSIFDKILNRSSGNVAGGNTNSGIETTTSIPAPQQEVVDVEPKEEIAETENSLEDGSSEELPLSNEDSLNSVDNSESTTTPQQDSDSLNETQETSEVEIPNPETPADETSAIESSEDEVTESKVEHEETIEDTTEETVEDTTEETVEETTKSLPNIDPQLEERIRLFTNMPHVIGMSFRGDGHIRQNTPCQDCHCFKEVSEAWSLAIVSDGAGSAEHSDLGSAAVCSAFSHYMTLFLRNYSDGSIPDAKTWDIEFRGLLCNFQRDLVKLAKAKNVEYKSLAATIILLAYSAHGCIYAHIGDGRAAIKINDEWQAVLTPHKGEEANQTIFSTSINYGEQPNLKLSGVYVPETGVSDQPIQQFVLMSDGLENGLWHTSERIELPDGDYRWEQRNTPFVRGIEAFSDILDMPEDKRKQEMMNYIINFNRSIQREPDDKTILLGKIR